MKPLTDVASRARDGVRWAAAIALVAAVLVVHPDTRAQNRQTAEHWVGAWATAVVSSQEPVAIPRRLQPAANAAPQTAAPTAPQTATPRPPATPPLQAVSNQTLREIVRTTLGGSRFRVVLTNAFGTSPLTVGAAHIALRDNESAIVARSGRPLTFGGRPSVTIPAAAVTLSDPVDLTVAPFSDLAIDVFVPGDTASSPLTMHAGALQTNYVSEAGNHAGETQLPVARTVTSWYLLSRVEVVAPASVGAVLAFGDSITDGTASTPNTNHRWPDDFARRLAAASSGMGVLNLGIGGNRLLSDGRGVNALARFDRDVAAQAGVTHMIVLEGINDIGFAADDPSPAPADLIAAHQQLIARAHARGLKVFGATLTPFEGAAYATAVGEAKRQQVNQWIRTSREYDGVVDFDAAVRDPKQSTRILTAYDPGDHLHFNDTGYQIMADTVDLKLFKFVPTGSSSGR